MFSCGGGNTLASYLINNAPKSGTDAVSNSPWILTSDREGEWRYAGKNPDNYLSFNGELWRIIGVMPNMEYCTGTYTDSTCSQTATGSLVKIIKNDSEGQMVWDDGSSPIAYNSNENKAYLLNNIVNRDVAASEIPSNASSNWYSSSLKYYLQNRTYSSSNNVAVVNWKLYGLQCEVYSGFRNLSINQFYTAERNLDNNSYSYNSNPTFWYGKIGLPYPSDYGYATFFEDSSVTRNSCLSIQTIDWMSSSYMNKCLLNDWMVFTNITNSFSTSIVEQWTIVGCNNNNKALTMRGNNFLFTYYYPWDDEFLIRPALYLKPDTLISGNHTGTYSDPYEIQ